MRRRNFIVSLLALVMACLFALILIRLLLLRYERGDVYPAYSTLRSDPLGTRAFYEALQVTGRYNVARGFASVHRELEGKPAAVFYLGLSNSDIPSFTDDEVKALDEYVKKGGRVLITLAPEEPYSSESDDTKKTEKKKKATTGKDQSKPEKNPDKKVPAETVPDNTPDAGEPQTLQEKYEREELRKANEDDDNSDGQQEAPEYHRSLAALWGFGWERNASSENKGQHHDAASTDHNAEDDKPALPEVLARRVIFGGIEPSVPWKSALYFVRLEPDWVPLYTAKDKPVMIRRHWGQGEIAVATDSYFISNEALRNDRRPLLLNYLSGRPGELLFDEAHLGTQEQEGVMALAEKFRLEGFLYGMLGVLVLFLWRNSSPLVPPQATDGRLPLGGTISGKDSRSGLVNLLRRNIPPSEILKVCLTVWKRGLTPRNAQMHARLSEMESVVTETTNQADQIVQSYQHLSKINAPGKVRKIHATKS